MTGTHQGHPRRWQILGVLILALFGVSLDNTILTVALPTLRPATPRAQAHPQAAGIAVSDPADGLAVLEKRGSGWPTAKTGSRAGTGWRRRGVRGPRAGKPLHAP